jgi:16S rRNA (cytidine1402-2'-O)-methyltransferase
MPLLVAATPIGNLQDASPRLIEALGSARLVLAEDTRVARKLYSALGVPAPTIVSSHAHNERSRLERALQPLREGALVLLLSDAGAPGLSDPGQPLVEAAHAEGLPVRGIPGPSAVTTALAVSGLPAVPMAFLGFPPRKPGQRSHFLEQALSTGVTFVLFEAPGRTPRLVAELAGLAPDRQACLCRELTKLHEEVLLLPLPQLAEALAERQLKGEVTLVVGPGEVAERADAPATIEGQKGAAAALAASWGLPKRDVYKALLELKETLISGS